MGTSDEKKRTGNRPDQNKDEKQAVNQGEQHSPAKNDSNDPPNKNPMLLPANLKLGRDDAVNEQDREI